MKRMVIAVAVVALVGVTALSSLWLLNGSAAVPPDAPNDVWLRVRPSSWDDLAYDGPNGQPLSWRVFGLSDHDLDGHPLAKARASLQPAERVSERIHRMIDNKERVVRLIEEYEAIGERLSFGSEEWQEFKHISK